MSSTHSQANKTAPFRYFTPAKRRATQYEEVTLHVQWDPANYAHQGWFNRDSRKRPPWTAASTLVRARDWWAYRDPNEEWFRPYVDRQAATGQAIEHAIETARRAAAFAYFTPQWQALLATHYAAYRYPEYGLFLSLCHAQREALSDVVASPLVFQGLEKDRHAQDIALYCLELEENIPGFSDHQCKDLWLHSPLWQPARRLVEQLIAARDWAEINLVINLLIEPLLATLFTRELVLRFASYHGDAVTPVIVAGAEGDRAVRLASTQAFVHFILEQDAQNREVIAGWLAHWYPAVAQAACALAPLFSMPEHPPQDFATAWRTVTAAWREVLAGLGLDLPPAARA